MLPRPPTRIFRDRRVFDESYRPARLRVRGEEAKVLAGRLVSRLEEGVGSTDITLVYGSIGKVGIGKTTVATYVGRLLEEYTRRRGIHFKPVYINVFGAPSLHQILSIIVDQLGFRINVRGNAAIEVLKALVDHLYLRNMHLLVILDEFQSLLLSPRVENDDLYTLLRVYEEIPPRDGINRVNFLLVASDFRVMSYMRESIPQVESQIGFRLHLKPYTSKELYTIISQRAEEGLVEGSWSDYLLEMIGEYFGVDKDGDGSARKAILTLRMAAELAEQEGSYKITESHVRRALSENALANIPLEDIRRLSTHELLILLALVEEMMSKGGWITTGELKRRYEESSELYGETPRGHTQFHLYLRSLTNTGLIEARPSGKGMRGRTTLTRLPPEIPSDRLKEVLEALLLERQEGLRGRV